MLDFLLRVSVFCFAASYAVALGLEVWRLMAPRPILRLVGIGFGAAGLLAHAAFVIVQSYPLFSPSGSLYFLALILAVFYLYGAIHHFQLAWGLFVLPLVLGLIALAWLGTDTLPEASAAWWSGERFWGQVHGYLVLLASVGICVGFVASLMYLVQVHRLKTKMGPRQGMPMWSLERIEKMNRRALLLSFPLLTAGLLVGLARLIHHGSFQQGWSYPKILSTLGLWLVFAILFYSRYVAHARGRQVAWLTLLAFALLLLALGSAHPFAQGGGS